MRHTAQYTGSRLRTGCGLARRLAAPAVTGAVLIGLAAVAAPGMARAGSGAPVVEVKLETAAHQGAFPAAAAVATAELRKSRGGHLDGVHGQPGAASVAIILWDEAHRPHAQQMASNIAVGAMVTNTLTTGNGR